MSTFLESWTCSCLDHVCPWQQPQPRSGSWIVTVGLAFSVGQLLVSLGQFFGLGATIIQVEEGRQDSFGRAAELTGDLNLGCGKSIKMSPLGLLPLLTCLFNGN